MRRVFLCLMLFFLPLPELPKEEESFRSIASLEEGSEGINFSPISFSKLSETSPMSEEEYAIALRICQSYRAKSVLLRSRSDHPSMRFLTSKIPCRGESSEQILEAKLRQGSDPFTLFFGDIPVETHQRGHLASVCPLIIRGIRQDNPSFWELEGDKIMELTFFPPRPGEEQYQLRFGRRYLESHYNIFRVDRFRVDLEEGGMVLELASFERCPGQDKTAYYWRTYLSSSLSLR